MSDQSTYFEIKEKVSTPEGEKIVFKNDSTRDFPKMKLSEVLSFLQGKDFVNDKAYFLDEKGARIGEEAGVLLGTILKNGTATIINPTPAVIPTTPKKTVEKVEAENPKLDSKFDTSSNAPTYKAQEEVIKDLGIGSGGSTSNAKHASTLTPEEEAKLLFNSHIRYTTEKKGVTKPYKMDNNGRLEVVAGFTAQFDSYELTASGHDDRHDFASTSYTEVESQLWMQATDSSTTDFGIPGIFNIKTAHKHLKSTFSYQRNVKLHCVYSQLLPKVRVSLRGFGMNPEYIEAVKRVVEGDYPVDIAAKKAMQIRQAKNLLELLDQRGHFVATDFLCGGRYSLHTTKTLTEEANHEQEKLELITTMRMQTEMGGLPVSAGGSGGGGSQNEAKNKKIGQYTLSDTRIKGGDPSLGSSRSDIQGRDWLKSLGDPGFWAVCAFEPKGLTLTLDLLGDSNLTQKCKEILGAYFKSQLRVKRTPFVGHDEDKWSDTVQVGKEIVVNRLRKVEMKIYDKLDGIRSLLQWESGNQEMQPWRGAGKNYDYTLQSFELDPDDEIVAIKVGWDKSIDALIFYTANGREFPRDANYRGVFYEGIGEAYGGSGAVKWATVTASNVKGLHGTSKVALDGIGLQYVELDEHTHSRSFLLEIETYIMND